MARPDPSKRRIETVVTRLDEAEARLDEAEARLTETERRLRLAHQAVVRTKVTLERLSKSGLLD